jgi:cytochrome P450
MLQLIRDFIGTFRALRLARDNLIAAWPVSFYRREMISERLLFRPHFIVNCPEGVQHVFVTNARNYRKSPSNSATLTPLLGRGLFVSEGELWTRQRRVMTPAVAHSRMADYAKVVVEEGGAMLAGWKAKGEAPFEEDLNEPFTLLTAEVICRIMFGYKLGPSGWTLYEAFKEYQASTVPMTCSPCFSPSGTSRAGRWSPTSFATR